MSAMNYLMMYGTDESSSGETSDEEKETVDQTAGTATGSSTANEEICQAEENTIKARASLSEISGNDSLDSDGSFFNAKEFPDRTSKKRTKKQIQKEDSEKRRRRSHALKAENCNCRFECVNKIGKDDRIQIHGRFWNLDVSGQAAFIRETVQLAPFTRRVKNQFIAEEPKKRKKYVFHLMADKIEPVKVCRKFYMNTIGFSENCGNLVYRCVDGDAAGNPRKSNRGKHARDTVKMDSVKLHINSFNPTISHYRREHAPNRLYLPSDLTQKAMYEHYLKMDNVSEVSYPFYCRVLKGMNISLVTLGHEECEQCTSSTLHQKQSGHSTADETSDSPESCLICEKYAEHLRLAAMSRDAYRRDGDSLKSGRAVLAVDLQKVIQLPRLDGYKSVIFSQRLLAYNETFAPAGEYTKKMPVFTCLWDEATAGRSANDITSCFQKVIERLNDYQDIIFWMDNCSAQNKN